MGTKGWHPLSAYVVSKDTIDRIVQLAAEGPGAGHGTAWRFGWYMPDREPRWTYIDNMGNDIGRATLDELGQILITECVRSVRYRYQDDSFDTLPGPIEKAYALDYRYERPARRLSTVEGLKLLDGYEYHSCEHPEWGSSEAHAIRDHLRDALISHLPGYSEAEWAA